MQQCGAIVVGRTSFDQGLEDWLAEWPWPDKQVYVLTSRPLPAHAPAGVIASRGGSAGLVQQLRSAGLTRDVQVLGGPRTIRALLELGAIDGLGLCVLPFLLGKGIPLFALETAVFSGQAWAASQGGRLAPAPRSRLRLESHRAFPDGALELVYAAEP